MGSGTGRRWRALATLLCAVALVVSSTGCLSETRQTRSNTISLGSSVSRPLRAALTRVVVLRSVSGNTQAAVTLMGECAVIEVGENHRTVTRRKRVTPLVYVTASILASAAVLYYMLPDAPANESIVGGSVLLAGAAATYGIPAAMESTTVQTLPPRPAERYRGSVECPLRPIAGVRVSLRDTESDREAITDQQGIAVFDGEASPGVRVYLDGKRVRDVRRR